MEKIYIIIQINMADRIIYLFVFSCFCIALFLLVLDICIIKIMCKDKKDEEESDLPDNNLVEFVGEDENGNWIYKLK